MAILIRLNQGDNIDLVDDNQVIKRYTCLSDGDYWIQGNFSSGTIAVCDHTAQQIRVL